MINGVQRLLYKLSCIAPICIILALTLYIQNFSGIVCVILGFIGAGGCVYAFFFVQACGKKLPLLKVSVDNISQEDRSALEYFAAYLIPLIGIVWKENLVVWIITAAVLIVLIIRISSLGFCPVLLLAGYHCYKVSLSTGIDNIVISKRKGMRNSKQLHQVVRISDTLMLEENGGRANV